MKLQGYNHPPPIQAIFRMPLPLRLSTCRVKPTDKILDPKISFIESIVLIAKLDVKCVHNIKQFLHFYNYYTDSNCMINKPMMKDIIYSKSYSASVVQCTKNLNGFESKLVLTSIMLSPVLIC